MIDFLWAFWASMARYEIAVNPFWGDWEFISVCGYNEELDRDWCT